MRKFLLLFLLIPLAGWAQESGRGFCKINSQYVAGSSCYLTLQAAHDALPAGGGTIFVPAGTVTGQRLTVSKPNVELYGVGDGSSIDVSGDVTSTAIITVNASGFKLHDIALNGNTGGGGTAVGVRLGNSSALTENHSVYRVHFSNFGSVALLVSWVNNFAIRDNLFTGTLQRSCVRIGDGINPTSNGTIASNECTNPDELAALSDSGFHANGSTSTQIITHITWRDNRVHINDGSAPTARVCFQLNNIKDSSVVNNYCDKAIDATHGSGGEGIAFTGEGVLIEGNHVSGSAVVGILDWLTTNGYKHHQIKNNYSYNNAAGFAIVVGNNSLTATDIELSGNHAYDAGATTQTVGLESYLGAGVTTISYSHAAAHDNFFDGNINAATNMWPGTSGVFQLADNQDGTSYVQQSANGGAMVPFYNEELITLATGATTTDSTANLLPANSLILAVGGRVTTTITSACTGWELGDATTVARFTINDTTLTLNETKTNTGTYLNTGIASATTGMYQASAAKVRVTCAGGNPGAGAVRVFVSGFTSVPPTK